MTYNPPMPSLPRLPLAALLACACGPLVLAPAADDGSGGVSSSGGVVGEVGEIGGDGAPGDPTLPPPFETSSAVTSPSTGVDGSTGVPNDPNCGNGVLDPGEGCDDGNERDGDACSSQCTPSVELAWSFTYDGGAGWRDEAFDVTIGADDMIWVTGRVGRPGLQTDLFLWQVGPDGALLQEVSWAGPDGLDDEGRGLAWTAAGDLLVVGSTESTATGDDVLVLVLDPASGAILWSTTIDGAGSGPGQYDEIDAGTAAAALGDGSVVVGATLRVGAGDYDGWLGAFDPDGVPLWSQTISTGSERDEVRDLLVTGIGVDALVGLAGQDTAAVRSYDGTGSPLAAFDLGVAASAVAGGVDGSTAVISTETSDFDTRATLTAFDAGWNQRWSTEVEFPGGPDSTGLGVSVGPSLEVVAVGSVDKHNEQFNAWVRGVHPDGTPHWGDLYSGASKLNDGFHAAAVDGQGDVIAVGFETVIGSETDALVRKYRPM